MKAGRELDALVAYDIMGLDVEPSSKYDGWYGDLIPIGNREFIDPEGWVYDKGRKMVPNYSTNMAAAWEVVEKMAAEGKHLRLLAPGSYTDEGLGPQTDWSAHFCFPHPEWGNDSASSFGCKTAPLAICLASLRVVGYNIENTSAGESYETRETRRMEQD